MKRPRTSRLTQLFTRDIWQPALLNERSVRGRFFALLRIVSITLTGMNETRA
jgi:membrane protein